MKPYALKHLPLWITLLACGLLLVHGPIGQLD